MHRKLEKQTSMQKYKHATHTTHFRNTIIQNAKYTGTNTFTNIQTIQQTTDI